MHSRRKKEVRAFYDRWKVPVFSFCRLFFGDKERANEATVEAFLSYLRADFPLEAVSLPDSLLRSAVDAVRRRCSLRSPEQADGKTVESAILLLPCDQRAVFILRNVLEIPERSVAAATGLPAEQVHTLWIQALMRVRIRLPEHFFKECVR